MKAFLILQFACLLLTSAALPNGAPKSACSKMKPEHLKSNTGNASSPFQITLSTYSYDGGDEIKGTLSAGDMTFKGFLIEVGTNSDPSKEETAVGQFVDLDEKLMKHVCGKGGITHVRNDEKTKINFTWMAPNSTSDLYFRATVVKEYKPFLLRSTYWMNAFSSVLKPKSSL